MILKKISKLRNRKEKPQNLLRKRRLKKIHKGEQLREQQGQALRINNVPTFYKIFASKSIFLVSYVYLLFISEERHA